MYSSIIKSLDNDGQSLPVTSHVSHVVSCVNVGQPVVLTRRVTLPYVGVGVSSEYHQSSARRRDGLHQRRYAVKGFTKTKVSLLFIVHCFSILRVP